MQGKRVNLVPRANEMIVLGESPPFIPRAQASAHTIQNHNFNRPIAYNQSEAYINYKKLFLIMYLRTRSSCIILFTCLKEFFVALRAIPYRGKPL